MTTTSAQTSPTAPPGRSAPPAAVRASRTGRLLALARAELILLVRNKTALFNAVVLAPGLVAFLALVGGNFFGNDPATAAASIVATLLGIALLMVVYYNLTTTFVARREELVLKRLITGEVTRPEIVMAYAFPGLLITLAQLALGYGAAALLLEPVAVQNALWLLAALAGGTAVFALLAVASSGLTRTVETAQLTTMPMLGIAMLFSGFTLPLQLMPDVVSQVASWTPLHPVVALVQHGFGTMRPDGTVASGDLVDVAQPLACLAVWALIGLAATRRWMRWEPRR
ncbi:ABC transporter permease [Georgenia halophila]|uniref:ABC transporter permease n=1 Tax=Georgenia halophila TaxID=620889 RepID=A0ABP8LKK0_9MICO